MNIETEETERFLRLTIVQRRALMKRIIKLSGLHGEGLGKKDIRDKRGVRTGTMRSRYASRSIRGGLGARIRSDVNYWPGYDLGNPPHVIEAKPGKFLKFRGKGGGDVFRRKVNHPGNAPRHVTRDVFKKVPGGTKRIADREVQKDINKNEKRVRRLSL